MRQIKLLLLGALIAALLLVGSAVTALAADPSITITVTKWNIPPLAPTHFEIEQTGVSSINITWAKGTAANITIIRGGTNGYPFSIFDGDAIYSGNETYVEVGSLDLALYTYYYRAWSQNEYGTSLTYAQATIGTGAAPSADVSALTALILSLVDGPMGIINMMFAVALMGFGFWKKSWIRVALSLALIIWGVFAMPYDIKVAAPFIGIGFILFIMGIAQIITISNEARTET
jgi:hypothetical protein